MKIGDRFLGRLVIAVREDSIMLRSQRKYANGNVFKSFWIKYKTK